MTLSPLTCCHLACFLQHELKENEAFSVTYIVATVFDKSKLHFISGFVVTDFIEFNLFLYYYYVTLIAKILRKW